MSACSLCPRNCMADRERGEYGVCGQGERMRVARVALHFFEEPPISGTNGSGTIFFCGCSLRCVFCQNRAISRGNEGFEICASELAEWMLRLQERGAHNINLVTPTHFVKEIAVALSIARPRLKIPVVYNSSGYESIPALRMLEGLVDVYMPDFKYWSEDVARRYSAAPSYSQVAGEAVAEMYRQVGAFTTDENGIARKGVLIRHLILPGNRKDSMAVLQHLAQRLPVGDIRLSLMSQYTPDFAMDSPYPELHRRLTRFEYQSVLQVAQSLGFEGYMQEPTSASADFTPDFSARKSLEIEEVRICRTVDTEND